MKHTRSVDNARKTEVIGVVGKETHPLTIQCIRLCRDHADAVVPISSMDQLQRLHQDDVLTRAVVVIADRYTIAWESYGTFGQTTCVISQQLPSLATMIVRGPAAAVPLRETGSEQVTSVHWLDVWHRLPSWIQSKQEQDGNETVAVMCRDRSLAHAYVQQCDAIDSVATAVWLPDEDANAIRGRGIALWDHSAAPATSTDHWRRRLHRLDPFNDWRHIWITPDATKRDIFAAQAAGVIGCLHRPATSASLNSAISQSRQLQIAATANGPAQANESLAGFPSRD